MPSLGRAPLALLCFGLVALVGLIVLTGTNSLHDDAVKSLLIAIASSCVTAAAGLSTPNHSHAPTPTGPPLPGGQVPAHQHTAAAGAGVYVPPGA